MHKQFFEESSEERIAKFFGIKIDRYQEALKIIKEELPDEKGFQKKTNILTAKLKLCLTLLKARKGLTLRDLEILFDASPATCYRYTKKVESILSKHQNERMNKLIFQIKDGQEVLLDVTEHKIERPKKSNKKRKKFYSGKKKLLQLKHK